MPNKKNKQYNIQIISFVILTFIIFVIIDNRSKTPNPISDIPTKDMTETTSPSADDQNDTTGTTETTSPSADDQNDTTDTTGATDTTDTTGATGTLDTTGATETADNIKLWDLINFSFGFPAVVTFIIFGIHQPFDKITRVTDDRSPNIFKIKYKYIKYYLFIYFMVSTIIFISLFFLNRQNKLQYNILFKTNFLLLVSFMKFLIVDLYHQHKIKLAIQKIIVYDNNNQTVDSPLQKLIIESNDNFFNSPSRPKTLNLLKQLKQFQDKDLVRYYEDVLKKLWKVETNELQHYYSLLNDQLHNQIYKKKNSFRQITVM